MLTISRKQFDHLRCAQQADFDERIFRYVETMLHQAGTPCHSSSEQFVETSYRVAARIGARTEQQIAQVAVIQVAIELLAVATNGRQSIEKILANQDEPIEQRLSYVARLLGIGA